jgi:hypothetical protein
MPRSLVPWLHYTVDHGYNLKVLYALRVIRDITEKLGMFFVPLFLFQVVSGLAVPGTFWLPDSEIARGMVTVALFYGCMRAVLLFSVMPIARVMRWIGLRQIMVISWLLLAGSMMSMRMLPEYPWLFWVAMPLHALQLMGFWMTHEVIFSTSTLKKHVGEDLGAARFLLELSAVLVPAFGGMVVLLAGYSTLFLIALGSALVGALASCWLELDLTVPAITWTEVKDEFTQPSVLQQLVASLGRYVNDASLVIWPIFVLAMVGSVDKVGFLYTFSLFIALIVIYFTGIYIDHTSSRLGFMLSTGLLSGVWLSRLLIVSGWGVALVEVANKMISNFHWLIYETLWYRSARGKEILIASVVRELAVSMGAVMLWGGIAALFWWTNDGWQWVFLLSALAVLISGLVREKV